MRPLIPGPGLPIISAVEKLPVGSGTSSLDDAASAGAEAARAAFAGLDGASPGLVIVYASIRYDLSELLAAVRGVTGDTPLIGAGTYADDRAAAVSATGSGEYFIRAVAAHQLAERVRLAGEPLQDALDHVLADIASLGGKGGLIAVSADGQAAWGFTTPAMYRGMADASGRTVAIYGDDEER